MPADPPRLPSSAVLLRPRWPVVIAASVLAFAALPVLLWQAGPAFSWSVVVPAFLAYASGLVVAGRSATDPRWFRGDPRPLSISEGALHAGGERLLSRSEITQAFVITEPHGRAAVQLRAGRRRVTLACDGEAEGHALLRALELDATRSTAMYRAGSRLLLTRGWTAPVLAGLGLSWAISVALLLLPSLGALATAALVTMGAVLAMAATLLLWPTRILVGADAVVIRWLGVERRIRLEEIDHVVRSPGALRLLLRDDEVIELAYPGKPLSEADLERLAAAGLSSGAAELGRAAARIEEALAAYPREQQAAPELSLERGKRGTVEWLRHLRSVGGSARAEQVHYRRPALPPERLWRIVEDPASPLGARAGAAVALAGGLDEPGKKRMRIAAEATALPGIRVLLESMAAEEATDEAALCEMLEQVDEGDEARCR